MTLGRLFGAWVPVALWFVAAWWAGVRLAPAPAPAAAAPPAAQPGAPPADGAAPPGPARRVALILGEAGVATLFAALWFASLGAGGWWLLFLLVGLLVGFPARLERLAAEPAPRRELLLALLDTARYVGAGAILAWRLR